MTAVASENPSDYQHIVVTKGRWELLGPAGQCFHFHDVVLDGQSARAVNAPLCVDGTSELVLEVDTSSAGLHVRSFESRAELHDLHASPFVATDPCLVSRHDNSASPCGARAAYEDLGSSPVSSTGHVNRVLLVGSTGYEEKRAIISGSGCVPAELLLREAGSLRVVLSGSLAWNHVEPWVVRLWDRDSYPPPDQVPEYAFCVSDGAPIVLGGLLPGSYLATLSPCESAGTAQQLASASVRIDAGAETVVAMTVAEPLSERRHFEISGIIYTSPDTDLGAIRAVVLQPAAHSRFQKEVVLPLGDDESVKARRTAVGIEWGPVLLEAGSYQITVLPVGFTAAMAATRDHDLVVVDMPPPRDVEVQVVLADGSLASSIDYLFVQSGDDPALLQRIVPTGASVGGGRNPARISVRGKCVNAIAGLRGVGEARVWDPSGTAVLTMKLQTPVRQEIRVAVGDSPFPMEHSWWQRVRVEPSVGSIDPLLGMEFDLHEEGGLTYRANFLLSAAGTFRFVLPALYAAPGNPVESSRMIEVGAAGTPVIIDPGDLWWPRRE